MNTKVSFGASVLLVLALAGAGCNNKVSDQSQNLQVIETDSQGKPLQNSNVNDETQSQNNKVNNQAPRALPQSTPRSRGMVRVYVTSQKSHQPVPGIAVVVSHSSINATTGNEGWVEFPLASGNVYIPKMNGFLASSEISTADADAEGILRITLVSEK